MATNRLDPPSKIIAVHLNYHSRIAQRGKSPAYPSYFLKSPSTLSASSAPVVRPAGCQLLAVEAEVALIIGSRCHQASVETAWEAVRWVTAANDLGVYDLRYADPGSNVHSKSHDGFTPVGPELLDANALGPRGYTLSGWINDRRVQHAALDDDLVFSFPYLVADLSRVMTLLPGDLILTGTPSGSTVADVGDLVSVEVSHSSGATTRRLENYIVEGTGELGTTGAPPLVNSATIADAYGTTAVQ